MSLANTPVVVISRPMPQQPRRRPTKPRPADRTKRYGMIFPKSPLHDRYDYDDNESTWSMSRSRTSRRATTSRDTSAYSRNSSPAQEIAARYRASHSGELRARPRVSSSVTYLDVPSTDGLSVESSMSPRVRARDSRTTAMSQASGEAYVMAIRWGRDRNIPCQRPGCRNVLPNIRALTSHLTLHDIDPVERYIPQPPYDSFLDMRPSGGGRQRRRYAPSPAPYAHSVRQRRKLREYLTMLTCCGIGCRARHDDF
ncbi:uncharacterized protein TRAVEDRAFT_29650 [Trametes versicolor FP-101664 SS1]|uniref:uncharacterized protein n=1 Tax=Trametes versicolor (strain FP-101664) TaxID=717944 RepID=UPI0004622874|nr:uncharacterized protein TRAVEDRAFT_29650 [Trametes versicolor FP-101664 SS1]EIW57617.1 hypothetical protein TRAVEDRAFT_29650 [Trametes versicolor FP-101664 SS1]